ncbi:Uncharacterised protein [Raoultella terrigena]|uniref:Uncharacterized protein n=1 Tax=Raoultella terrigena TaxID=577 RepID=A0A4U9DBZ4_RAOTE|nr:Uncharacterised protein [Raoultella terrigena]
MVKVLPDPVTPSSVWCARPSFQPLFEATNGFWLIARGRKAECSVNVLLICLTLKEDEAPGAKRQVFNSTRRRRFCQ